MEKKIDAFFSFYGITTLNNSFIQHASKTSLQLDVESTLRCPWYLSPLLHLQIKLQPWSACIHYECIYIMLVEPLRRRVQRAAMSKENTMETWTKTEAGYRLFGMVGRASIEWSVVNSGILWHLRHEHTTMWIGMKGTEFLGLERDNCNMRDEFGKKIQYERNYEQQEKMEGEQ